MEIDPRNVGVAGNGVKINHADDALDDTFSTSSASGASDVEKAVGKVDVKPIERAYHFVKWKRFRKDYHDDYLDLFNDCVNEGDLVDDSQNFQHSQIGAVQWSSEEKKRLFTALAKYGQHDLKRCADVVATKSPLEIAAYLKVVHDAHVDRQRFMAHAKNVSFADMPAAIEIGQECEAALERAGDALNAYQEQYDATASENEKGSSWLIDRGLAVQIDTTNDNAEIDVDQAIGENTDTEQADVVGIDSDKSVYRRLFNFSTMIDLSEQFFMNNSSKSPFPHWKDTAEPGQAPAMTEESAQMLYDLVVERVRTVLRVVIHIARSRMSSMSSTGYSPSQKISQTDVLSALDVLGMPHDDWDFWTGLARRNQSDVVTGSHNKGESRVQYVSYEKVEATLAPRRGRGRRRTMSIGSETSSLASGHSEITDPSSGAEMGDAVSSEVEEDEDNDSDSPSSEEAITLTIEQDHDRQSPRSPATGLLHSTHAEPIVRRKERKLLLEDAVEQYAEQIDQGARLDEESRLWQILGKRPAAVLKVEEDYKYGPRPKTLRKTQGDLQPWSCAYLTEWEYYGNLTSIEKSSEEDLEDD